tara:strand:- start:193 stop:399 length:207 start_codon:yes stop_codon:yes gene_type:complete
MNAQTISTALQYDGDAIAQVFFNALTDANFHQETRVLHAAWEAMACTPEASSDAQKIENIISALRNLK